MFAYVSAYGKLAAMRELQTDRLLLRPLDQTHTTAMHDLCVHPDVRRYLFKNQLIPISQVEEMVQASVRCFTELGTGFYAVEISEADHDHHGEFVGFCGLRYFDGGAEIEMVFGMNPDIWGRGYGGEAARIVLQNGFSSCGIDKVLAAADTPNQRSIKVLQKLGMSFRERREWHGLDTMFYELSAQDFVA